VAGTAVAGTGVAVGGAGVGGTGVADGVGVGGTGVAVGSTSTGSGVTLGATTTSAASAMPAIETASREPAALAASASALSGTSVGAGTGVAVDAADRGSSTRVLTSAAFSRPMVEMTVSATSPETRAIVRMSPAQRATCTRVVTRLVSNAQDPLRNHGHWVRP